jgi:hypothetical protein
VTADVKSPIARVSVEAAESLGAPASRVRVTLSQPVAHHVRSERNTIVIDFDRPSPKAAPYALPPVTRNAGPAPDAMMALRQAPAADPIAALGLDTSAGGPSASSAPGVAHAMQESTAGQVPNAGSAPAAAQQPQTPAVPTPTDQLNGGSRNRQFTGHPISLDFQGADLRAVLRTSPRSAASTSSSTRRCKARSIAALHDAPIRHSASSCARTS